MQQYVSMTWRSVHVVCSRELCTAVAAVAHLAPGIKTVQINRVQCQHHRTSQRMASCGKLHAVWIAVGETNVTEQHATKFYCYRRLYEMAKRCYLSLEASLVSHISYRY